MKLTPQQAVEVWKVLCRYGAEEVGRDWKRFDFIEYLSKENDYGHEFRFEGIFGMGGKLRLSHYRGLSADYYHESRNPFREEQIALLNAELQGMWFRFQDA